MPTRNEPEYYVVCCDPDQPIAVYRNQWQQCPRCMCHLKVTAEYRRGETTPDPSEPPGGWEAYAEHSLSHDQGVNHVPYRGLVWSE